MASLNVRVIVLKDKKNLDRKLPTVGRRSGRMHFRKSPLDLEEIVKNGYLGSHKLEWLINYMVSEGLSDSFHQKIDKNEDKIEDARLIYVFSIDLPPKKEGGQTRKWYVCRMRGCRIENILNSQGAVCYLTRMGMQTGGYIGFQNMPPEMTQCADETEYEFINISEMLALEKMYERCMMCGAKQVECEYQPVHKVWCTTCFEKSSPLGDIRDFMILEAFFRKGCRWVRLDGDKLLMCLIKSKYLTILIISNDSVTKNAYIALTNELNLPTFNQFTVFPSVPTVNNVTARRTMEDEMCGGSCYYEDHFKSLFDNVMNYGRESNINMHFVLKNELDKKCDTFLDLDCSIRLFAQKHIHPRYHDIFSLMIEYCGKD